MAEGNGDDGCGFMLLLILLFCFLIPPCNKLNSILENEKKQTELLEKLVNQ